jgi:hypothetical protein
VTEPERPDITMDHLFLAYLDLYSQFRALLAVVAERSGWPAEHLEAQVERWRRGDEARVRGLIRDANERFVDYVLRLRPGSDQPPPAQR